MKKPTIKQLCDVFIEGYVCVMLPLLLAILFWLWVAYIAYMNESYAIAALGGLSGGLGVVLLYILITNQLKLKQRTLKNYSEMI